MSFEKQMYEVKEKWEESYFSQQDVIRIEHISTLIPEHARTLLDVGCGNGILVNYLSKNYGSRFDRICGTDRSETSLEFVKTEKHLSSIDQLPFKDGEFQVVTCLEVIEHLPLKIFSKAIEELLRVTSEFLIISVPYNEDLDVSKIRCIKCSTEFNPFYHMHSFRKEDLRNLISDDQVDILSIEMIEKVSKPIFPYLKKWISRRLNPNAFPANCICPMCGYNEFAKLKNSASGVNKDKLQKKRLTNYWPHRNHAKWIAAVYKKKSLA